jgi:hypothetical protein
MNTVFLNKLRPIQVLAHFSRIRSDAPVKVDVYVGLASRNRLVPILVRKESNEGA